MDINSKYIPSSDVVFGLIFQDPELYKILLKALFGEDFVLLENPRTQALNQSDVLLNKVWFDTMVLTNKGYYSVDMQRTYNAKQIENRTIYYACRLLGHQKVDHMEYEKLQPVCVTFIMQKQEGSNANGVRFAELCYSDTKEPYGNLMKIAMIFVPTILEKSEPNSDLYILADFFAIETQEEGDKFEADYGKTKLGVRLMSDYARSICDIDYLNLLEQENAYYIRKKYEDIKENYKEDMEKSREEGVFSSAKKFLDTGADINFVSNTLNIPIDKLKEYINNV
jgi:predicted transposase/invertase (TIGR01784 family)